MCTALRWYLFAVPKLVNSDGPDVNVDRERPVTVVMPMVITERMYATCAVHIYGHVKGGVATAVTRSLCDWNLAKPVLGELHRETKSRVVWLMRKATRRLSDS